MSGPRGLAAALGALALVALLAPGARAQGTAVVLDASESARRGGAKAVEAGIGLWLAQAPGEVRAFGTGEAALVSHASPRVALEHDWGGASNLIAPIEDAAHWLAAVPGERALVVVSDLELDVVGPDDAPQDFLQGLPDDADREQVNEHARELFRLRTLPRLRELGARVILVRLPLAEDGRRVSLADDLAGLPGAIAIDPPRDPEGVAAALARALPPRPSPAPTPSPTPTPAPSPSPTHSPSPTPSPTPRPSPTASPLAPTATRAPEPAPELGFPWLPAGGGALVVLALGALFVVKKLAREPRLADQRLVLLGADGKTSGEELVLKKSRVARAKSRLDVGTGALELEASEGGGVRATPTNVAARIEGVPVRGAAELVHGMVIEVETGDGESRSFVYLEREPNVSEKRRTWIEPRKPAAKPAFKATEKDGSISDVGSVDDFYVVDESEDSLEGDALPFGSRQVFALDAEGRITGEPQPLRAHRLDSDTAGVQLDGRLVTFHVDGDAGAILLPLGPRARLTVEGLSVGIRGVALVNGMVFELEGKPYVYLDRDPTVVERARAYTRRERRPEDDSLSDVASEDELLVLDDSDDEASASSGSDVGN